MSCGFPIRKSLVPPFASFFLAGRSGFWYPAPVRRTPFPLFAALFACALSARAAAAPLWCEEGAAVFGGGTGGVARVASPAISVTPDGSPVGWWENGVFSVCAHTTAPVEYRWTLLPDNCLEWLVPNAYGDAHLSVVDPFLLGLFPAMNGGPSHGGLSFWNFDPTGAHSRLWGPLSAPVASHPCAAGTAALCLSCGRRHGSEESCFHADDCASRTNLASACTCPPPFVRIGDALSLRLAGEEGCCCASLIVSPDLLSASPALGATVSNDWIVLAPTDRSPTIGGHSAQYRVFDATGGVHRTLTLRATAAGLGIDPLPWNAPVPYDWQEGPEAYYVTNGTLWLARRPEPYPVRVWNRSPSDARLIFAFDSTGDGPKLKTTVSGDLLSALCATNTALAAPDADLTVWLDASGTNGAATLSLTLSDPTSSRTLLSESLCVRVIDTDPGEHWRVRSADDTLSWDFSDAPEAVYAYLWRPNADSVFGDLIDFKLGKTPSISLDLPPGDYLLDFYFPRVYDGGSWAAWSTNTLHVRPTPAFVRDAVGVQCGTDRRVSVALMPESWYEDVEWTVEPVVEGGPRLHSASNAVSGATALSGLSNVWVSAGSAPGVYRVTASYPGVTNAVAHLVDPVVDLNGDFFRDGTFADDPREADPVCFTNSFGFVVPCNNNDSDGDGVPDCGDRIINGPLDTNDLSEVRIEGLGWTNLPASLSSRIRVEFEVRNPDGGTFPNQTCLSKVQLFARNSPGTEAFSGPDSPPPWNMLQVATEPDTFTALYLEGTLHGADIECVLRVLLDNEVVGEDAVRVLVAPFLVMSNADTVLDIYTSNADYIMSELLDLLPGNLNFINSGSFFPQDQGEFCMSVHEADGQVSSILIEFENGALSQFGIPNEDCRLMNISARGLGGNVESSPPSDSAPYGTIVVGDALSDGLYSLLEAQTLQSIESFTTGWLEVGHIDELVSFLPNTNGCYYAVVADLRLGISLLSQTNEVEQPDPVKFGEIGNPFMTRAGLLEYYSSDSRQTRISFIQGQLETLCTNLVQTLSIPEECIIRIPVLFSAAAPNPFGYVEKSRTMLPNMVNLFAMPQQNGSVRILIPKPYYLPFANQVENSLLLAGFNIQELGYVDTYVLHDSGRGELHCGTNARRIRDLVNMRTSEHEDKNK